MGGTAFKRYLDLAKLLDIKTVVMRDNDKDYQKNCVDLYADHVFPKAKVFSEKDNSRHTFEICVYEDNKEICEELFSERRRSLTVKEYMIKNKAEAAFALLQYSGGKLATPSYIEDAMRWIKA